VPVPLMLMSLAEKGLAACDSFAPLRQMPQGNVKQTVRARVYKQDSGRWEAARPARALTLAEQLDAVFARYAILCRETAAKSALNWPQALEKLRVMEFSGQVARGYFVKGLSGAQFVRADQLARVTAMLRQPDGDVQVLSGVDPMQAWGNLLPHEPERAFMCVPGTAVCLTRGRVGLLAERQGEVLTWWEEDDTVGVCLAALVRAFKLGRVFPGLYKLTVKQYPEGAGPRFEAAGFVREMRDYVLMKG